MKDKLIAVAMRDIEDLPAILYGPPNMENKPNPILITSICVGAIAIIVGIVVAIKKKFNNKKDDKNAEDVKKQ